MLREFLPILGVDGGVCTAQRMRVHRCVNMGNALFTTTHVNMGNAFLLRVDPIEFTPNGVGPVEGSQLYIPPYVSAKAG